MKLMGLKSGVVGVACAMTVLAVSTAQTAVINVPADQPTIQAGIHAAVDGE